MAAEIEAGAGEGVETGAAGGIALCVRWGRKGAGTDAWHSCSPGEMHADFDGVERLTTDLVRR